MPPTPFWLFLGLLVVIWGFWSLRPQKHQAGDEMILAQGGETPPTGTATPAPRPALQPIEAVVRGNPPPPPADTGYVGEPALTPPASGGAGTAESYTVAPGDTLSIIADRFEVTLEDLMAFNGLTNPHVLHVGQVLVLPTVIELSAPYQHVLPDSEVILSPAYKDFDLAAFVQQQGGFLATYREEVEGSELSGIEIVDRVSQRYSVGPRVLLALLEHQSGWLTEAEPAERAYPLGLQDPYQAGLFRQLSWAANRINQGYYGKASGRNPDLRFKDGTRALYHPDTNPGTAAIQNLFAVEGTPESWADALAQDGFYATYVALFGDPWQGAIDPLLPAELAQPELKLPWPDGETWYYTGGPHGGWGDFSGWAALDFVPSDHTGCQPSAFWATAAAAGKVIRSENGEVVIDLDGDGFIGTGWTLLYMHMGSAGRVGVGTEVQVGDPIGRPSCEGGVSDAAHLHIARRYNGQWIDADGSVPFVLDGWRAQQSDKSYDGFLIRGEERREACACRQDDFNGLTAR